MCLREKAKTKTKQIAVRLKTEKSLKTLQHRAIKRRKVKEVLLKDLTLKQEK
jgi:hypothetical protein